MLGRGEHGGLDRALAMVAVLKTGMPVHGVEGLVERPDGSRISTMAHIAPVKDENGRIVGAINCFHETTEFHLAAEALRTYSKMESYHCILSAPVGPSCGLTFKSCRCSDTRRMNISGMRERGSHQAGEDDEEHTDRAQCDSEQVEMMGVRLEPGH
jgi:hypothetical protein